MHRAVKRADSDQRRERGLDVALVLGVVALAAFTRLRDLGVESFWLDEATTFDRARLPWRELITNTVEKLHVPTYFLFMHHVVAIGDDEWTMRLPSAVFGVLKVVCVVVAGTMIGGPRAGAAAGLLQTLAPPQLRYDQEARMYAMQTFGTCLALVGQVWVALHPKLAVTALARNPTVAPADRVRARVAWASWILGSVFALYMHNTSALFLVACSCAALVTIASEREVRRGFLLHWTAANLAVMVLWLPWLPRLIGQVQTPRFAERAWGDPPTVGFVWAEVTSQVLLARKEFWINALVVATVLFGVWALRRRSALVVILLLLSLLAPIEFALISIKKPMFLPRTLLWGAPPFFVLAGQFVGTLRRTWLQLVGLAFVTVVGLWSLEQRYYGKTIKSDWRSIASELDEHAGDSRALLLLQSFKEERALSYYTSRSTHPFRVPRTLRLDAPRLAKRPPEKFLGKANRVFHVHGMLADKVYPLQTHVAQEWELLKRTKHRGVIFDRYRKP